MTLSKKLFDNFINLFQIIIATRRTLSPLRQCKTLDSISGIGESIADKIMEYRLKGKIETFEKLKKQVPYDLLQMMDITGIGPATIKILHEQLHINDRDDLIQALETDPLKTIRGFGEKKTANNGVLKFFRARFIF